MTPFKTKTVKVRIAGEASTYLYEGHQYSPGDMLEIPENLFVPYLMEKVVEEKKKKTKTEPTKETVQTSTVKEELTETEVPAASTVKPRRRRAKTT